MTVHPEILHLKITLIDSDPVIWRRIQVPTRLSLKKLHEVIQVVMGWQNSHLHQFILNNKRYSDPKFEMDEYAEDGDEAVGDTSRFRLSSIDGAAKTFLYEYDFGDDGGMRSVSKSD